MELIKAVFLGIVQGLGEFLPISSSAHLVLVPKLLGWEYQGLTYDVMLHLGTLVALVIYFRKDWIKIISDGLGAPSTADGKILWYLVAGTIPAGIAGVLLEKKAEDTFRAPAEMAVFLMAFAVVLYWADRRAAEKSDKVLNLGNAIIIGAAQALALMPGVSRSGITITAALLLGFGRSEAARVSFLFSVPVIAGAALLQLRHVTADMITVPFVSSFLAALISGWFAVKFLMGFLRTHTLKPFVYYRLALGAFILFMVFFAGLS
jgi:undecaprenyl-diphosphatase